eukprot:5523070-Pyramimonas_sp.AAC.1
MREFRGEKLSKAAFGGGGGSAAFPRPSSSRGAGEEEDVHSFVSHGPECVDGLSGGPDDRDSRGCGGGSFHSGAAPRGPLERGIPKYLDRNK